MPTTELTSPSSPAYQYLKLLPVRAQYFCHEYMIDFNGKQAAIRAGYAPRAAASQAARMLTLVNVSRAIHALATQHAEKIELTATKVMEEVARIAFSDPRNLFDADGKLKKPKDWDKNTAACVASYDGKTKTVRLWSKTEALSLASRITKIVDADVAPTMHGNFVVLCPADATPEQWDMLARAQMVAAVKAPTVISSNGESNSNGLRGLRPLAETVMLPHSNGNGSHANGNGG